MMRKILFSIFLVAFTQCCFAITYPSWVLLKDNPVADVRSFGAVGDGVTDDRAAIQRALDSGAKEILFLPGKTYLVNSYGTSSTALANNAILELPLGNCLLRSSGSSTIKIGSFFHGKSFAAVSGMTPGTPHRTHVSFENLTFDGNWENNYITAAGVHRIMVESGSVDRIRFSNCIFQNADLNNCIALGYLNSDHDAYVDKCRFVDLVSNTSANNDFSCIYSLCANTTIRDCYFYNTATQGAKIACATEFHGSNGLFQGNRIDGGYTRGCFVAAALSTAAPNENGYVGNVLFSNNIVYVTNRFVDSFITENNTIDGIFISNNVVYSTHVVGLSSLYNGYQGIFANSRSELGSKLKNVTIEHNTFRSLRYINTYDHPLSLTCPIDGFRVTDNNFYSDNGLYIRLENPGSATSEIKSLEIIANRFYSSVPVDTKYLNIDANSINGLSVAQNMFIFDNTFDTPIFAFAEGASFSNSIICQNAYSNTLPRKKEFEGSSNFFNVNHNNKFDVSLGNVYLDVLPLTTPGASGYAQLRFLGTSFGEYVIPGLRFTVGNANVPSNLILSGSGMVNASGGAVILTYGVGTYPAMTLASTTVQITNAR